MSRYEAHVQALVRHFAITRQQCGGDYRCSGANYPNVIMIPHTIKGPKDYAAAMHEIGHTQTFHRAGIWSPIWQGFISPEAHNTEETLAWNWAREHTLWWTPPMHKALIESYVGHRRWILRKLVKDVHSA